MVDSAWARKLPKSAMNLLFAELIPSLANPPHARNERSRPRADHYTADRHETLDAKPHTKSATGISTPPPARVCPSRILRIHSIIRFRWVPCSSRGCLHVTRSLRRALHRRALRAAAVRAYSATARTDCHTVALSFVRCCRTAVSSQRGARQTDRQTHTHNTASEPAASGGLFAQDNFSKFMHNTITTFHLYSTTN